MTRRGTVSWMVGAGTIAAVGLALLPVSPAAGAVERMRVCDQNLPGYTKYVDAAEEGHSSGDSYMFTDKLLDPRTGRKAGRHIGQFTVVRPVGDTGPAGAVYLGRAMFFFPRGRVTIELAGPFDKLREGASWPVTGGTGRYENATGTVFVESRKCDGKGGTIFAFDLQI